MSFYIDASAILAVIGNEAASSIVDGVVRRPGVKTRISDLTLAECSAALARNGRVRRWSEVQTEQFYRDLDEWALVFGEGAEIASSDIADAIAFVRLPGLALRAPDAIHIAAARRLGATLLTLDHGMAQAAAVLDVPAINPAGTSAL